MNKIRRAFTLWYIKRGYTFEYDFSDVPGSIPKTVWNCPWWVVPLLIFFSPSTYVMETIGKTIVNGLLSGLSGKTKGE